MRKVLFIVFVFLFVADGISIGVVLRSRYDKQGVQLRWASDNFSGLQTFLLHGVSVYRCEKEAFKGRFEQQHFLAKIQAWPEHDFRWKALFADKKQALFLHQFLYGKAEMSGEAYTSMGGLLQLLCGTDSLLATACGLYFRDTSVAPGKNVVYGLLNDRGEILALTDAQSIIPDSDPPVDPPHLKCRKQTVMLDWNREENTVYAAWEIERSADGKEWRAIHTDPVVAFINPASDDGKIYFSDSIPHNNQSWYYRIRGINHFGGRGPYSVFSSCYCYPELQRLPETDTIFADSDSLRLRMKPVDQQDRSLIEKFVLERSDSFSGEWKILETTAQNNELIFARSRKKVSYYRLNSILKNGDTLRDWPYLFVFPDEGPPAAPSGLYAVIDSLGAFRLSWDENTESDLRGYRVFMKNSETEEWLERSSALLSRNTYEGQLPVKTLNSETWFAVKAVDSSRNSSAFSSAYVLKLPDRIAPPAAVWKKNFFTRDTLFLKWSAAVGARTELIWKNTSHTKETWTVLSDSAKVIPFSGINCYLLKSCDSAGNCSFSDTLYYTVQSEPSDRIFISVRKEDKKIRLEIDVEKEEVFRVQLYKSVNGKDVHIISTWPGGERVYFDSDLKMETLYAYRAKVIKSNGKSSWSPWVELQY